MGGDGRPIGPALRRAGAWGMLDGISPAVVQGGAVSLLLLLLVTLFGALWKGIIYTRPQVEEIQRIQEARVQDGLKREDKLQQIADKWQETAKTAVDNKDDQLEQGRMIIALLQSHPRNSQRR